MSNAHYERDFTNPLADLTARHRDLLWILSQRGTIKSLPLKDALNDYYTTPIEHGRFCETLDDLVDRNLVDKQAHDLHTIEYSLTERARRALSARQAWQAGHHGDTTAEGHN
jgi:DNA-binding PadR family transcriptional regulator